MCDDEECGLKEICELCSVTKGSKRCIEVQYDNGIIIRYDKGLVLIGREVYRVK